MEYAAFLRFTLASTSYAWGSTDAYRSSQWHDGVLTNFPLPQEAWPDSWGLLPIQSFDIQAAMPIASMPPLTPQPVSLQDEAGNDFQDEAGNTFLVETDASLIGTEATLELVRTEADGEHTFTKTCLITAYRVRPGLLTLTLADLDSVRLDATYPAWQFTTSDWPELFTEHVGRPVPFAVGTAIKVPLTLIRTNGGAGPWVYAACEASATVLTVYREGRIVDAGEYTVATARAGSGYEVITLSFDLEQTDSSGRQYALSADMSGSASTNAATELSRILGLAGLTADSTTFAAAATQASTDHMLVDCRYVEPRSFRGIVDDLSLVLRGHIWRTSTGAIAITQDVSGTSALTLDEVAGDLLAVDELASPRMPASIELSYKPSPADPGRPLHTLRRYTGGLSGVQRFEALYLSDHEAADRLACYLALRASHGQRLSARVYAEDLALGDILTLSNSLYWSGSRDWRIASIQHPAAGASLELIEYAAAIYTYTAGTLPADATTGYQPDYSNTPPAAPTGLAVNASGAVVSATGHVDAWVGVRATPPAVNCAQVWFAARNDATGEEYQVQGYAAGGYWYAIIPGLRPAAAHTLIAWAVNANGVLGEVSAGVAHTSATDSGVPAVPTGLAVYQATGNTARVRWAQVTDADLSYYELQFTPDAGANWYTLMAAGATSYVHVGLTYGTTYQYQVRAVDKAGNASAYCTAVSVTPAANVGGTDITGNAISTSHINDSQVTSAKRQAINVASTSTSLAAGAHGFWQFTHNLGRDVVVTPFSGNGAVMVWVVPIDTNSFYVHGYNWGASQNPLTIGAWYW